MLANPFLFPLLSPIYILGPPDPPNAHQWAFRAFTPPEFGLGSFHLITFFVIFFVIGEFLRIYAIEQEL